MFPNLEALELTDQERSLAREEIRRRAYAKWQAGGCPHDDSLHFWNEAEREWIAFCYVPDRELATAGGRE